MDASNWINLGILAATAIAGVIAVLQVVEARSARSDAQAARDEAGRHETEALKAAREAAASAASSARSQQRIADAAEERLALERKRDEPVEPWIFTPVSDANSDQQWLVVNNTGEMVLWAAISTPNGYLEPWIKTDEYPSEDIEPGEAIEFTFLRRLSSPTSAVVWVTWVPADGSAQQRFAKTIS